MTSAPRMTVPAFRARKGQGAPLVVLTAYDVATASAAEEGGVDCLLVGDSLANVILGYERTLSVTMDEMLHHARAVGRARRTALLVVDLPWLSFHLSPEETVRNAARFVREAGADAVKLEGGARRVPSIVALLDAEIPVMGHLGLTPQSVLRMGGYKVQGRDSVEADALVREAVAISEAGVFAMVLEGIPAALAERITREVLVPTIGIGAGVGARQSLIPPAGMLRPVPVQSRYAGRDRVRRSGAGEGRARRSFPSDTETYG
jgi:3-methyl-2-oxobutanoate hydroxymethyltransferase